MKKLLNWENAAPLHRLPLARSYQEPQLLDLEEVIEYAAQMLPAEGPITGFSFLSALHAFEHLPFEEAVKIGLRLFGGQPYLPEERYREELKRERIRPLDLQAVLEEDLGKRGWETIAGLCSRLSLRMAMLQFPVLSGSPAELQWYMAETGALLRFRPDASPLVRNRIHTDTFRWIVRDFINRGSEDGGYRRPGPLDPRREHVLWPLLERFDDARIDHWDEAKWESFTVQALWRVCQEGVRGVEPAAELPPLKARPRDVLLEATGADSDTLVHEVLIRFCAAFADQGYAHWRLPHRELGFYKSFLKVYRTDGGPPQRWLAGLGRELARLDDGDVGPMESIHESLELLGIDRGEWEDFFPRTVLALRGWASMIRQMDVRGDRFPVSAPRGTLTEYLAVRLILERFALAHVAREKLGYRGPLKDLRSVAQEKAPAAPAPTLDQRTFGVFQLAQVLGWSPLALHGLTRQQWATLVAEVEAFSGLERRRVFQLAFEHRYQTQALDALSVHTRRKARRPQAPRFQASFCIDAREESFRRYLEEVCPEVETFSAAGFYGVPIYFRGVAEATFNPLCPVVAKPAHWMAEEPVYTLQETHRRRAQARRVVGACCHHFSAGSRTFALGAVLSAGLGVLASVPLVARVLFPRLSARIRRTAHSIITAPPPVTRLVVERAAPAAGPEEHQLGFSLEEMINIAERILRDIGLTSNFARLFFFLGHRSEGLNNPHKSAYDCGACTGPGGPNARALAVMLNDPRVRAALAERGLHVPDDTVFVGGHHNTALDSVVFYDLDLLPRSHRKDFELAKEVFEQACKLNAHERCRRFDSAPLDLSLEEARRHVEGRAEDLAQVRPEFGNATNALCFVGRHERTRGLFMDRRAFQQSYDPTQDDAEGTILARILSAVIPVCQGINLQYYFSHVDPARWGSGTKLPHNVTALLGVMDGAASDLRQGLPWQGVEIHEPLRCLFVIETTPEVMLSIMDRNKAIDRIVRNNWSQLAVLAPGSNELRVFRNGEFQVYHPENLSLPRATTSTDWYRGSRTFLELAQIEKGN
jgi:uncharacterized protein YbcC (UPF0753/DUF2309 family)